MAIDWKNIFDMAAKWPELRIAGWKRYKRDDHEGAAFLRKELHVLAEGVKVFHLSADLVWIVTQLANEIDPALLIEALVQCRMPFKTTLFAWPTNARADAIKALNETYLSAELELVDDKVYSAVNAESSMLVLTGVDPFNARILMDMIYVPNVRKLVVAPLGLTIYQAVRDESIRAQVLAFLKDFKLAVKNEENSRATRWMLTDKTIRRFPESAQRINDDDRLLVAANGPLGMYQDRCNGWPTDKQITNTGGSIRWFAALCYLMEQPRIVRYVQGTQSQPVIGARPRASSVPTQQATMLTTFLPREKVVTNLVRVATHPRKSTGEHDVQGFWSISHHRGRPDCQHKWPRELTRRQVCSECGALRWWKPESKRGHGPLRSVRVGRRLDYGGRDLHELIPLPQETVE